MNFKSIAYVVIILISVNSKANVLWLWSFESEAGLLVTDGEFEDTKTSNTFTILSFEVTESMFTANIGVNYVETQPASGFLWNGTTATQFFRSGGILTNGSNFFVDDFSYVYRLQPEPSFWSLDDDSDTFATGPYLLQTDQLFIGSFD